MNKRRILFGLILGGILVSAPLQSVIATNNQQSSGKDTGEQQDDSLPIVARYTILFHRLAGSQRGVQQQEPSAAGYRKPPERVYREILQREVPLSEDQLRALEEIAKNCQRRIADVDSRAKAIIDAFRQQHQRASPTATDEQPPAAPRPRSRPTELVALQEEHDSVIMQAREQVHVVFGEEAFQRFEKYIVQHGNGRTFTLPSPDRPAIALQATATALSADKHISKTQFQVGEKIAVQIELINNSTRSISVRQSDLYDWFEVYKLEGSNRARIFIHPPERDQEARAAHTGQATSVELVPGQQTIVGVLDFSDSTKVLKPGRYIVTPHPRALMNRPPDKSEFVDFVKTTDAATFEVVP